MEWVAASTVVQAVGAVTTAVATAVLAWVTWRYVKLTGELVEANRKSLEYA